MMGSDGMDDVTILVNSSPGKVMGANLAFANGFPAVSNAVLCAKASMLLQVRLLKLLHFTEVSMANNWENDDFHLLGTLLSYFCLLFSSNFFHL